MKSYPGEISLLDFRCNHPQVFELQGLFSAIGIAVAIFDSLRDTYIELDEDRSVARKPVGGCS